MSYVTNDTQAPYHRMPGRKPPRWILILIATAMVLQLLYTLWNFTSACL